MHTTYRHTTAACYIGYIVQAAIANLPPLLFVTFRNQFNISMEAITLLISINFAIQMLVDFIAAKFIGRIGCKRAAVAAHFFSAAGLAGIGILPFILPPYAGLCVSIILSAIGGGLIEVVVSPIVDSLPGEKKAASMSLLHSLYCWGQMAVVLITTALLSSGLSWRWLPLIWAAVPFINAFFFMLVPISVPGEEKHASVLNVLRDKGIYIFIILMLCAGAAELAISQWASLFAESGLKLSKASGDIFGPCLFAACMGAVRLLFGFAGRRLKIRNALMLSAGLCIIGYLIAGLSPWPALALAGCALCGLSVALMWPGTISLCARSNKHGASIFGLLAMAGDIGCVLGPALVGFVSDGSADGLQTGMLTAIIFPVIMFAALAFMRLKKES